MTCSRTSQTSRDHRVDHLLGRLDVLRRLALDELGHDERLEQLERHELGQAALVQAQRRARHDDRAARVVHALAEQVLAEAALLALEHVAQRLQRPVARAGDGPPAAAVVEQGVDGLLEHALLVVDDDLGRAEVEQPLEPVVAVDDAPVEVVEVRRGEAATVELDHRAQLRRDDRDGLEDHHLRLVARVQEGREDLQALDRAGLLLALAGPHLLLEVLALVLEHVPGRSCGRRPSPGVRSASTSRPALAVVLGLLAQQLADVLGAHAAAEVLAEAERRAEAVLELTEERLVRDDQSWAGTRPSRSAGRRRRTAASPRPRRAGRRPAPPCWRRASTRPSGAAGVLVVGLGVVDVGVEGLLQLLVELLALLIGQLLDVDVERLGPEVVLLPKSPGRPSSGTRRGPRALPQLVHALASSARGGPARPASRPGAGDVAPARLPVDPGDDRRREVQDLLELLRSHVEQERAAPSCRT